MLCVLKSRPRGTAFISTSCGRLSYPLRSAAGASWDTALAVYRETPAALLHDIHLPPGGSTLLDQFSGWNCRSRRPESRHASRLTRIPHASKRSSRSSSAAVHRQLTEGQRKIWDRSMRGVGCRATRWRPALTPRPVRSSTYIYGPTPTTSCTGRCSSWRCQPQCLPDTRRSEAYVAVFRHLRSAERERRFGGSELRSAAIGSTKARAT
jgi:hypothetical protein